MFPISIITPSGKVFEDRVESVAAPGLMGGFEVYSNHMPFLSALKGGVVRVRKEGKEFKSLTIDSGILEVNSNHEVLILADQIIENPA